VEKLRRKEEREEEALCVVVSPVTQLGGHGFSFLCGCAFVEGVSNCEAKMQDVVAVHVHASLR